MKTTDFSLFSRFTRFTDDTVLTVAIADSILNRTTHQLRMIEAFHNQARYAHKLKEYGRKYPNAGYGEMFAKWLRSDSLHGYRSYANGSAMRVSAIGFAFDTLDDVLREARLSAVVTHNHPQGITGAQAVASAVYLARIGKDKPFIKSFIERKFGYNLSQRLDDIRPRYAFDSSCKGSVPQSIIAFLESNDFEDAIRKAVSLGGDSDTLACMTGGIAQAYYKQIPAQIVSQTRLLLDIGLKRVMDAFNERYHVPF